MAIEPTRWGVIYNPKAGSRKAQKRWKEIRDYMESREVQFDYVQSEGFGSVERLSRTMANNGYRTIVVVGGDGALNDAVNGIMFSDAENKQDIALGIIPNGIGNDFAKYWGPPAESGCRRVRLFRRESSRKTVFLKCRLHWLGRPYRDYHKRNQAFLGYPSFLLLVFTFLGGIRTEIIPDALKSER